MLDYLSDASSLFRRGLTSAAPHWLSHVGSSVLSSAEAQYTQTPLNKKPVLLPADFLKLGSLSSLLLKPKIYGLH